MGPQGFATFPGVQNVLGCTYTLNHGISPSVAMLDILPQEQMPSEGGTLTIGCGTDAVQFHDCKVDKASFRRDGSGMVYQFAIFDRRWKWAFGAVSGWYNVHKPDFSLWPATEKTPQELATLLLDAIGETGYDVSQMPNDARPEVEWDGGRPMDYLAQLCDLLGCRVVLGLDGNVRIYPVGVGQTLPGGAVMEQSATIDPAEIPDKIAILCGHTRYQCDFELEAVGKDTDGKIKPIAQLSYAPAAGWFSADIPKFNCITAANARELARETVLRWYRIKVPFDLPGFTDKDSPGEQILNLKQILPIEDSLVTTYTDTNGVKQSRPATVHGVFITKLKGPITNSDPTETPFPSMFYTDAWSLDQAEGIVKFAAPVYRNTNTTQAAPGGASPPRYGEAKLRLRAVCCVRAGATRGWMRWRRSRQTGGQFRTETAHWIHDEIVLSYEPVYALNYRLMVIVSNQQALDRECDYYLDAIERDLLLKGSAVARYLGTLPIEPDGAIQQITWSVSPTAGHFTVASWNDESANPVMPYNERRARERQRGIAQAQAQQAQLAGNQARKYGRGRPA
jgi:hypothetical protein